MKVWLSSDTAEGVFGDGKWRLLKAVEKHGSLSAAAESLGISYRKAWGDIRKMEECLGARLAVRMRGGDRGGRTHLTDCGRQWIAGYERFRADLERTACIAFEKHMSILGSRTVKG